MIYSDVFLLFWIVNIHAGANGLARYRELLKYSELEKLGAACSPLDTCSKSRDSIHDNLEDSRCHCQATCARYNTCCIDSPFVRFMPAYWNRKRGTCQPIYSSSDTILMVSECLPGWGGSADIKLMCEEPVYNIKDPIGQAPVTNLQTEVTYKNYFCAVCNNDTDFLEIWNFNLSTSAEETDEKWDNRTLPRKMELQEGGQWVVKVQNDENEMVEEIVEINYVVPARVSSMIIPCMMNVISECAEGWNDDIVSSMCHAYMGIVYLYSNESEFTSLKSYRNIHCAICNNISYSKDDVCEGISYIATASFKPPFSFTLLLDVNLADGNKVGEVNRCGKQKMYDPFFKKCRTLVCGLPNYAMEGNMCVKAIS